MAVIGIDLGTQSLKAVVVDDDMRLRGESSVPYQPSFPAPGWAEQDPVLWLQALKPAIGRALAKAGLAGPTSRASPLPGNSTAAWRLMKTTGRWRLASYGWIAVRKPRSRA